MEQMDPDNDNTMNLRVLSLDTRRTILRRESHMRRSIEKAGALRKLLNEGIAAYNRGSRTERQIIAFALYDTLRDISVDDMAYLKVLLQKAATGLLRE